MRLLPLAILALMLAAGCVLPGAERDPSTSEPAALRSFFHSSMTLAPAPEQNASVVRTGGFYESWADGTDYPTWAADAFGRHVMVTNATVTLFLQSTGPVVENPRFPDIMVYGGSADAWMGFGARTDLVAIQPGSLYKIEVELEMPPGGLWLAPDANFGLKVVAVMLQQDERADIEILVGGDRASRVDWSIAPVDISYSRTSRGDATGEVTGTIYAGPAAPATTSHATSLPVPPDVRAIWAWMNTTQSVGVPDVDLSILGPDGELITTSGTPTPREGIRVAGPNLQGGGDYKLVVTTAGAPRASYALEWIIATG